MTLIISYQSHGLNAQLPYTKYKENDGIKKMGCMSVKKTTQTQEFIKDGASLKNTIQHKNKNLTETCVNGGNLWANFE